MAKRKKKNSFLNGVIFILFIAIVIFLIPPKDNKTVEDKSKNENKTNQVENKNSTKQNNNYSTTLDSETLKTLVAPSEKDFSEKESYKVINANVPFFTKEDLKSQSFESYSPLDKLGRVSVANATIGIDIMPKEKRREINKVHPSGWVANKNRHVYDRCHLIGFQLAGENDNEKNLMTGTRTLNVAGMLPFENEIANYVKRTKNHVRYRVTPIFKNDDLVAQGVLMEAKSIEDDGKGVMFNVFCYNAQKGVNIDYKTGHYTLL